MYERFTDRARKVMQFANQEAQRLNHEYIDTEHILLGLLKEGNGIAAHVLETFGVDLKLARIEVEKIVPAGPDRMVIGKLPHSPRAKKVIEYAIEEAHNLNHNYVGTEHLLLGLLREQEGVAAQVLMNLNLKLDEVRSEIMKIFTGDSKLSNCLEKTVVGNEGLKEFVVTQTCVRALKILTLEGRDLVLDLLERWFRPTVEFEVSGSE